MYTQHRAHCSIISIRLQVQSGTRQSSLAVISHHQFADTEQLATNAWLSRYDRGRGAVLVISQLAVCIPVSLESSVVCSILIVSNWQQISCWRCWFCLPQRVAQVLKLLASRKFRAPFPQMLLWSPEGLPMLPMDELIFWNYCCWFAYCCLAIQCWTRQEYDKC